MPKNPAKAFSYIRFSTPDQLKGDSLRRQKENSERYAREHGLELVEAYQDLGLSAFKGRNRTEGALAGFLAAVKDKRIKAGSFLIVEDLDRLSRQAVEEALPRFLDLINAGIIIVTLTDNQVYRKGHLSTAQLLISLTKMSLAHDESAKKSGRLKESWQMRRTKIGEKKITGNGPRWLQLSPDGDEFLVIPERVALVRRIFADTIAGKGRYHIVNDINKSRVAPWSSKRQKGAKGWHSSYIHKLLNNRAVLGEFQPHVFIDGKRTPTGDVIRDYYPKIIGQKTFNLAKAAATKRKNGKGRVTVTDKNLFAGLCRCSQCLGTVSFSDKGDRNKTRNPSTYMRCFNRVRKSSKCKPFSTAYGWVEEAFLKWCVDFDFSGGQATLKQQKEAELAAMEEALGAAQNTLDRFNDALAESSKPVASFLPRIQAAEAEVASHQNKIAALKAEIDAVAHSVRGVDFAELVKVSDNRFRLRAEIRVRVERITFHFGGATGIFGEHVAGPAFSVELKSGKKFWFLQKGDVVKIVDERGKQNGFYHVDVPARRSPDARNLDTLKW